MIVSPEAPFPEVYLHPVSFSSQLCFFTGALQDSFFAWKFDAKPAPKEKSTIKMSKVGKKKKTCFTNGRGCHKSHHFADILFDQLPLKNLRRIPAASYYSHVRPACVKKVATFVRNPQS